MSTLRGLYHISGGVILLIISLIFNIVVNKKELNNEKQDDKYYFNETMSYDGIEITVSKMATIDDVAANSDLKRVIILYTLKNTRSESFSFQYSDFHLETEDKGERYSYVSFETDFDDILVNELIGESLLAGETKNFYLMFDTPYMADEKKFILCINWDSSTDEQKYYLYNRDGSLVPKYDVNEATQSTEQNTMESQYNPFTENCPISVNAKYYGSSREVHITAKNKTNKTIQAIKYLIVVYDIYGNEVKRYGYGSSSISATFDRKISSKSSDTGGWNLTGFSSGKYIDIYVCSVHFSDGTEWGDKDMSVRNIKEQAPKYRYTRIG